MFFKNSFDNMTAEEKVLLEKYFCGYNYEASSHTFIANYIWKDTHHITWEIIGEYLCLLGMGTLETEEKEYFMSFPLTRRGFYDPEALRYTIDTARAKFAEAGVPFEISMIPESLAPLLTEIYGDEVILTHDRDDDDYIYLREELAELNADIFSISRGMVSTMSDIKGVDIWVNFTETEQGVLCGLRSSKYNINPIAVKYGGGGHAKASGATVASKEIAMQMLSDLDALTKE